MNNNNSNQYFAQSQGHYNESFPTISYVLALVIIFVIPFLV